MQQYTLKKNRLYEKKTFAGEPNSRGCPVFGHSVLRKTDPRYLCQRESTLKWFHNDPSLRSLMELKMALSLKTHYDLASIIQDIINTIEGSPSADVSSVSSIQNLTWKSGCCDIQENAMVLYCGVDHNDLHQIGNEIHSATYPLVPRYIVNIPDKLSPEQEAPLICAAMFSRHTILSSSLCHSGILRNIEDDGSVGVKSSNADDLSTVETLSTEKVKVFLSTLAGKSYEENGLEIADATEDDVLADQVATLVNYEKSPLQSSSANDESANQSEVREPFELNTTKVVITNGESGLLSQNQSQKPQQIKKPKKMEVLSQFWIQFVSFGRIRSTDSVLKKGVKEEPNDKLDDRSAEASTSASSSHVNQGNTFVTDSGKIDLATQLRATIAQKQMENDPDQSNGRDILHLTMGVLKEDVIGIDGLGFDDKLPRTILATFRSFSTSNGHSIKKKHKESTSPL
ncbi:MAP3K epsilon protein kinase 1-like protein isoform X1 [Tanacetum coccineum]